MRRAGYYYMNWNKIFEEWKVNAEKIIKEMESVEFNDLPEFEDDEVVFKHLGYSKSSSQLYENFHKLVLLHFKLWQKHFEMLNLGCATYLTFYLFCKEKFQPEIERRKKTNRCGEKEQTAAGPRQTSRGHHKAVYNYALGHNERKDRAMVLRSRR
jgi:hypothetical protein